MNFKKIAIAAMFSMLTVSQSFSELVFKVTGQGNNNKGCYLIGILRTSRVLFTKEVKVYYGYKRFNFKKKLKSGDIFKLSEKKQAVRVREFFRNLESNESFSKKIYSQCKHRNSSRLFPKYRDLFEPLFGIDEGKFRQRLSKNKARVKRYAGEHKEYTYDYLKKHASKLSSKFGSKGSFSEIRGKSIQQIIAQEDLSNAVIQSASTSSGLEGGMHKKASYLSGMQRGAVQGETVAACLLYGSIDKKYYQPIGNYLSGLVGFYKGRIKKFDPKKMGNFDKMKIGMQKNTTIAYKADMKSFKKDEGFYVKRLRKKVPYLKRADDTLKTSHIACFALDFNSKRRNRFSKKHFYYIELAKEFLKRQYLMTVWAACFNGIKKVYFTALGGGSFNNEEKWINDAIYNLELQEFIKNNGMKVYLVRP